jgi:hypothetical protein
VNGWTDTGIHNGGLFCGNLEGLIEAHEILKGDDADEYDELLWKMAAETCEGVLTMF